MCNMIDPNRHVSDRRQIPKGTDGDVPFIWSSKQAKVTDGLRSHRMVILGKFEKTCKLHSLKQKM